MANMTLDEALGISALADEGESIHVDINTRQVAVPAGPAGRAEAGGLPLFCGVAGTAGWVISEEEAIKICGPRPQ